MVRSTALIAVHVPLTLSLYKKLLHQHHLSPRASIEQEVLMPTSIHLFPPSLSQLYLVMSR
jgi:hypothetical protein